jgi:hypothetical protein
MMREAVVVAPNLRSFSSHIFFQASQNVIVKVRADHSVELGLAAPFLLLVTVGSSTATIVALLLDHNRKSSFRHPL